MLVMKKEPLYYGSYLHLEKILDGQHPVSFEEGHTPAHDEMLFIIIHQAYELWFKQILFELDYVMHIFSQEKINDNSEDMNLVRHRLHRIIRILELLNQQITILNTMTPLDFLEFRNLLTPSSGFQSAQFRLIEARLGLQIDHANADAAWELCLALKEKGLLAKPTHGDKIRFAPPLLINREQILECVEIISESLAASLTQ